MFLKDDGLLVNPFPMPNSTRRMYTDHRVMGQVVLPGVSHVSLMAAWDLSISNYVQTIVKSRLSAAKAYYPPGNGYISHRSREVGENHGLKRAGWWGICDRFLEGRSQGVDTSFPEKANPKATASLGFPSPGGGMGDWHISWGSQRVSSRRVLIVNMDKPMISDIGWSTKKI